MKEFECFQRKNGETESAKTTTKNQMITYYTILGINENADLDKIKEAYRKKVLLFHPDINPRGKDGFIKIQTAYETLSDPIRKKNYDYRLKVYRGKLSEIQHTHDEKMQKKASPKSDRGIILFVLLIPSFIALLFALTYIKSPSPKQEIKSISNSNTVSNENSAIPDKGTWINNSLKTGAIPYLDYFGEGLFDKESLSCIKIKNGYNTDAIVLLMEIPSNKIIRNIYIRKEESFKMDKLPEGLFKLKCYSGVGWDPQLDNGENFPRGGFISDVSFYESKSYNDCFDIVFEKLHDGVNFPTFQVTLYKVSNGNMETKNISKDQFFG